MKQIAEYRSLVRPALSCSTSDLADPATFFHILSSTLAVHGHRMVTAIL